MTIPLETRLRQAMRLGEPDGDGMGDIDLPGSLVALGNIVVECLAHIPEAEAEAYLQSLMDCRSWWMAQPRVLEQLRPEGRA